MTRKAARTSDQPRFAVLGAGNVGMAFAGHLALKGYQVALYDRDPARIQPVEAAQAVQVVSDRPDLPQGRGRIALATTHLGEALDFANFAIVCVPCSAHEDFGRHCGPYLRDHHRVLLSPGKTGGALAFWHAAMSAGCGGTPIVAEAQTVLYASQVTNPGQVRISRVKNGVPVAAIPAARTTELTASLSQAYPEFLPAETVMHTSLGNTGSVFHPAIMVLNAAHIEATRGEFEFYIEGVSKSVANVLERIDRERTELARHLGFGTRSAREWLAVAYGAVGSDLFEAMRANEGYYGIKAPHRLSHPYLVEEVPTTLVPMASLGRHYGLVCPTIEAIIHLAGTMTSTDYWSVGRTVERMGLAEVPLKELGQAVREGPPIPPPPNATALHASRTLLTQEH
ncbi:MAG: NAD/NADP octopine/nopaline dehydrogenase family protein [Fimbriimonadales bacterium]